jgi:dTDP-4-dehydrorhamnose 3,5-epimerase
MSANSTRSAPLPLVIVPKRYLDDRGWFSETFHQQRLRDLGITCTFVQDNQSSSRRAGTVRGFHFQRPPMAQAKLLSVLRGRILDVAVDIRQSSPSFGKYVSMELSAENGRQLYVPAGFAHGFISLEDDVIVMYKTSNYYAPSHEGGIRWSDPDIAFPWPFKETEIIKSDKDERLPYLKEFESPFAYDGHSLATVIIPSIS